MEHMKGSKGVCGVTYSMAGYVLVYEEVLKTKQQVASSSEAQTATRAEIFRSAFDSWFRASSLAIAMQMAEKEQMCMIQ